MAAKALAARYGKAGSMMELAASEATSTVAAGSSQEGRPAGAPGLAGRWSVVLLLVLWLDSDNASPGACKKLRVCCISQPCMFASKLR